MDWAEAKTATRDLVIALSPCGALEPSPRIAAGAVRGGGRGVIDLGGADPGDGGWTRTQALSEAAAWSAGNIGVRVPGGCPVTPEEVRDLLGEGGREALAVLTADSPWDVAETASWARVLVEVTSLDEAADAARGGAHGVIARGAESSGRVSELSTFVLLQQLLADCPLPVWAAGGIGPHTAAGCVLGGAAGVVLDTQLGLMPESDLPGDATRALRHADGTGIVVRDGQPGIRIPGTRRASAKLAGMEDGMLPAGQDASLAPAFADRWRDTAAAVSGIRAAIESGIREASGTQRAIEPGAPLAEALGLRLPVVQGPMTRVSDVPGFAAAVATEGALPMIALALADGDRARKILRAAAGELGDRPWGVGILGFVPEDLRAAQLAAVLETKPPYAIIAGGRPHQARELEQAGIATFLHVPSPRLLRQFLDAGARRFVFEGAECGGHTGPRSSFTLWESQLTAIGDFLDANPSSTGPANAGDGQPVQVLFAGGIHDARSAAIASATAGPAAARGVQAGVLMGTSYLFTAEAVSNGAITPLFQRLTVEAAGTALLETSPGHVTRALRTQFTEEFAAERAAMEESVTDKREVWARLEQLNIGRLRLASRGVTHEGEPLDEATQAAEGLYMAGQVAALRDAPTTVRDLHATVTSGAGALLATRAGELSALLPARAAEAEAEEDARPMAIAVTGMSAVFAGSPGTGAFWRTILSGEDMVTEVPRDRWDPDVYHVSSADEAKPGRHTVSKWGAFLEPVPINPLRYGIPPSSLGSIDPSQLLALEAADQAMRDAGCPWDEPGADHSKTGVVFGAEPGSDDGAGLNLRGSLPAYLGEIPGQLDAQLPRFTGDTFPGHLANVISGRIGNRFDLRGPNFTVDAACAASLAAVDAACKHLAEGTADTMLCGGVDLHNSIGDFLMFGSVQALSPSGRVAAFDSKGDGTALGEGVACVVLKRLADAERDGDRIYAVIRGVGAASDGRARSLTAPRADGQIRAMRRAYRQAGVSPADVGLVEAHGTGTALGDQTELESLTTVFGDAGAEPGGCVLGSVKSQIGHTKCAAGLAGLVKAALAVYHGVQPPTANLKNPSPPWEPGRSPFAFLTAPRPWLAPAAERFASVSAFGFGGTNFHVVLSGHGAAPEPRHGLPDWPAELFCFRGTARADVHRAVASFASTLADGGPP
ncbi:MAG: nitronate monooxygenase, partial [Nocardiopsaceae bacterium]|nr:nitronate monooxygenase [Nocardiopsaceae bacterium]